MTVQADTMSFQTLRLEVRDRVAVLTLNRPERLNAFVEAMHEELRQAMHQVETDSSIGALLLTGAGRGFCAGADLTEPAPMDEHGVDLGATIEANYNPLIRRLRRLEKPSVAAVNGPAAGAGMSLALACDITLAARSASFLQAFCNIGLVPDAGSTWFLPRLIGRARAAGMTLLGEKLPAETAAEWGLIWKCLDDDKLMPEAFAIARKLANGPTRGLTLIKQALEKSWEQSLDAQLDLERDSQRTAARTEDFAEGVSAFLNKRTPVFKGR